MTKKTYHQKTFFEELLDLEIEAYYAISKLSCPRCYGKLIKISELPDMFQCENFRKCLYLTRRPAWKPAQVEAPAVEAPAVEAPVVEAPVVEAPVVEAPVVEEKPERVSTAEMLASLAAQENEIRKQEIEKDKTLSPLEIIEKEKKKKTKKKKKKDEDLSLDWLEE